MIKEANPEDVKMAISNGKVLLDVWKNGCQPCMRMNPILEKLDKENSDVLFVKINADDNLDYAINDLGVRNAPTFILFEGGKEVNRATGYLSEVEMSNFIGG